MILEARLRSLAFAALALAVPAASTGCITELPEIPEDLEAGGAPAPGAAGAPDADGAPETAWSAGAMIATGFAGEDGASMDLVGHSLAGINAPVTLYEHVNYTGRTQTLTSGIYDVGGLSIGNDDLSSLKVPSGMTVKLYEHSRYRGSSQKVTADRSSLVSTGFNDKTSSVAVYGSISEPSGSPHALGSFTDVENLKYRVASDPTLIRNLAYFAHYLGFAWCGGTQSPYIGHNFDVFRNSDGSYSMNAHYNSNDPYADGDSAHKRLKIRLKNFRVTIDPSTFAYEDPVQTELTPIVLDEGYATNPSGTDSMISVALSSSHTETYSHETSVSLTLGVTVGITASASVPFGGGVEASTEFSFSTSQGWTSSTTTSEVVGTEWTYTAQVPAQSRKRITLLATRSKSDVSYTANAHVSFDIELEGFLRSSGNARSDHPTHRPTVTATFGSSNMPGFDAILDQYDHSHIPGYSGWDWDWIKAIGYPNMGYLMGYFRRGITVPLSGEFSGVMGTTVFFQESVEQPL